MPRTVTCLLGPSQGPAAHQELALAVIIQAIRDLERADGKHRNEAELFLSGHAMLAQWCGVARIDPDFVKDVVRKRLEIMSRGRSPRRRPLPSARTPHRDRGARRPSAPSVLR